MLHPSRVRQATGQECQWASSRRAAAPSRLQLVMADILPAQPAGLQRKRYRREEPEVGPLLEEEPETDRCRAAGSRMPACVAAAPCQQDV